MKRLITISLILALFIPFLLLAQESSANPESYFNDLIKTLKAEEEKTVDKKEEPKPDIPKPESILGIEEKAQELKEEAPKTVENPAPALPASLPAPVELIAPAPVASPNIILAKSTPEKSKKVKDKKNKKGNEAASVENGDEKRLFQPYIAVPTPKSRSQKIYIKKLEKKDASRMRLITLDNADIVYSRSNRPLRKSFDNPANLGIRSEYTNSLSIIPFNTIDIDAKTSFKPFVFIEDYLSTGELLTPEREDSLIASLGENGLELPIDISIPTVLGVKFNLLGGSVSPNIGLYVQERMKIPTDFFSIIFDGTTITDPFQMTEDLGVDLTAYFKGSLGYGTYIELPAFLGELRFGGSVNAYAGAFSSINISELSLIPNSESTKIQGTVEVLSFMDTLNFIAPTGGFDLDFNLEDEYLTIPSITLGYDVGLAWRFKLNRLIPIFPKFFKNYVDVQVGVQDLGAKITMNHAYIRQVNFEAEAGDLIDMFAGDNPVDLSSLMVLEETMVAADTTITRPLGTKFNIAINYQPISLIMLKGSYSQYITEGLNSNTGLNYSYGAELFPFRSLALYGSVNQKGQYRFSEAGFRIQGMSSEFGLTLRVYDLDFSLTENLSGAGLKLYWARYF